MKGLKMSIEKYWNGRTKMHIPTCDICGKQLAEEWTFQEAVEAKKNAGWCSRKIDNEWIDICDDCKWDQYCGAKMDAERKEE
jgi:hypothetical protein